MTRLLPALAAGVICGVAGMRQASGLRRQAAALRRWEQMLRQMAFIMQERTLPLPDVMTQAASEAGEPDQRLRRLAEAMRAEPLTPLTALYEREQPTGPEAALLGRLMERLWHGSLEHRVLALTQAAEEIALLADAFAQKTAKDARMWSQLGWAVGACLTLLLI